MDDDTKPQSDDNTDDNKLASLTPASIKKPVQDFSQKLTNAADGADDVAKNLEQVVDHKLQQAEKKIDDFLSVFDKFLGGKS